jgi:hypothetical protein
MRLVRWADFARALFASPQAARIVRSVCRRARFNRAWASANRLLVSRAFAKSEPPLT